MHPQCPHRPTFCVNSNLLANHRSRFLGLNADLTQNWRIWAKTRSWNDASWCLRGWGGRCGRDGLRIGWRPDCTTSALAATDNSTHLPYPSQHHPRHTNEDGWMIKMECVMSGYHSNFYEKILSGCVSTFRCLNLSNPLCFAYDPYFCCLFCTLQRILPFFSAQMCLLTVKMQGHMGQTNKPSLV